MKTVSTFLAIVLAFIVYFLLHRPITHLAGVLIESEPAQIELGSGAETIEYGDYKLKPLARFSVHARVLHRKIYRYDRQAKLAPVDLALGWREMSDQAVLDRLNISQSTRFYWYQYQLPPPIPREQIVSRSTNVHVIPATPEIASFCKSLRRGELVRLEGRLVEAAGPTLNAWRSSLSRTDSGNGACELMLVEDCSKLDPSEKKPTVLVRR
jgi:hypothetical protein